MVINTKKLALCVANILNDKLSSNYKKREYTGDCVYTYDDGDTISYLDIIKCICYINYKVPNNNLTFTDWQVMFCNVNTIVVEYAFQILNKREIWKYGVKSKNKQ